MLDWFTKLDTDLFLLISGYFAAHSVLKILAQFFAHDAIFVLVIVAILAIVSKLSSRDHQLKTIIGSIAIFISAAAAWCINNLIGLVWFRARPFVTLLTQPLVTADALSKSFPSDHAGTSFAIAWALMRFDRRYGGIGLSLAALISIGRVAAGVHYPTDIIAGAVVGITAGEVIWRLFSQPKVLSSLNSLWPKPASSQPPDSSV